jgi:hypothetical protein
MHARFAGLMVPKPKRLQGWARLAKDLDVEKLAGKTKARSWKEVAELAPHLLAGQTRGLSWKCSKFIGPHCRNTIVCA